MKKNKAEKKSDLYGHKFMIVDSDVKRKDLMSRQEPIASAIAEFTLSALGMATQMQRAGWGANNSPASDAP